MISYLHGIARKGRVPVVSINVNGVGYEVQCSGSLFESAEDGEEIDAHIYTFVREDRMELFGFATGSERELFINLLSVPGVGPRMSLQLCSVPSGILCSAVENQDTRPLSALKGVGKKMAEKLLVELSSLVDKGVLVPLSGSAAVSDASVDEDAVEALANLGYDRKSIIKSLNEVRDAKTTEERVKRVLQTI